jgi:hypothetical protein
MQAMPEIIAGSGRSSSPEAQDRMDPFAPLFLAQCRCAEAVDERDGVRMTALACG